MRLKKAEQYNRGESFLLPKSKTFRNTNKLQTMIALKKKV